MLIYFERGGKESGLEGLLKEIKLKKKSGEKLRQMREKRRRNKEGIKIKGLKGNLN